MTLHSLSARHGTFMAIALLWLGGAYAATTDIANAPMASAGSSVVKPNIMFILDDSGSMAYEHIPDAANNFTSDEYGFRSNHCNGLAYNPATNYLPPVDSKGVSFANATFTKALANGYDTGSATSDLTNSYYYAYTGKEPHLGFTYDSKGVVLSGSTFFKECNTLTKNTGKFTKVTVSATTGPSGVDGRVNYANWYSYYRNRMLLMKTAAGRAFMSIGDTYRVGLTTINYTGTDNANGDFLNVEDFTPAHKDAWYTKFYNVTPGGGTPLRAALAKVGRIYAGKIGADPVQFSCQQNFSILSTDGYWNNGAGYQIDGKTAVGNQDSGATPLPMFDKLAKSDTLSDVSMYYYKTDLRTEALQNCENGIHKDLCTNNVPGADPDTNPQQHMTTFTLGLGVDGTLVYADDYLQGGSADFKAISQGTKNWPAPVADESTAVDDLWHAAVNGRGVYFSAKSPDSLVAGISKALSGVSARTSAAAAAATSNLEPVPGDNYVYVALYRTVKWDGDLQAKTIDPNTGVLSTTPIWSARPLLDAKVSATTDTRTIHTFNSATGGLKPFTWAELSAAEKGYFNDMCGTTPKLSHCSTLTTAQQTAASGQHLVNFLRGQNGFEDEAGNTDRLYRDREHVLGDMISSQPVYVKKPPFAYVDDGYTGFVAAKQDRKSMVYVAVNDGMLHAFNGETGVEEWAYIPPMVMPNLYQLADKAYSKNHRYFVDGSPTVGDVCPTAPCAATGWRTVLIGGLNAGGRGYYALDVTDPNNPKALWNFTVAEDADLGLTFGNPVITKRKDGTWVVAFTSGYNNVVPGDGKGYLYILNAYTGAKLEKIATGAGDTTTPSGLSKINAWIESTADNTTQRFYGGDLLGNVWRFDIDDNVLPAGKEAVRIAELGQEGAAKVQPVTTKPELTEIKENGKSHVVVNVATGRYLGLSDLSNVDQQSIYSFKDELTATGLGNLRGSGKLVKQTMSATTSKTGQQARTTTKNEVTWSDKAGWYVDLNPDNTSPGERVNIDMQQQLGLLTVVGNVPDSNACTTGGYAWLYYLDYKTGQYVSTATDGVAGLRLGGNALAAGIKTVKLVTDKTVTIITDTGGGITTSGDPTSDPREAKNEKRVSWRELID